MIYTVIKDEDFVCECGKTFHGSQSFYGHQCHCVVHLGEDRLKSVTQARQENQVIGYNAYNKKRQNEITEQKKSALEKWVAEQHTCEKCGKIMTEKFGSGRFCSKACANSHERTEESKIKTSKTIKAKSKKNCETDIDFNKYVEGTKEQYLNLKISGKFLKYYESVNIEGEDYVVCPYCDLRMAQVQVSHLATHGKTKNDLFQDFGDDYLIASKKSTRKRAESSSKVQAKLIAEHKHKGWQSRKIKSFPEEFWEKVLVNNGIEYDFNHVANKIALGLDDQSNYFLDFFIDGFIDLEIDGKQHQYPDRKASDRKRDIIVKQNGLVVYRIPWIAPNTPENSAKVKEQINEFLEWYNDIKDEEGIIVYVPKK